MMNIILCTIIFNFIIAAALFYLCIAKSQSYWKEQGIKYVKSTFLFGETLGIVLKKESIPDMVYRIYQHCPGERYYGIYHFFQRMLIIRDPDLIKQVAVKDFDHFVDRHTIAIEDPLIENTLISLRGEKWKDMRATLSPIFTSSKMKNMFTLMSDVAENFVEYFQKSPEEVVSVELKDIFTRYSANIIAGTAFGVKCDSMTNTTNEFYKLGKKITEFISVIKGLRYMFFNIKYMKADESDYFRNLIKETIKTREENHIVRSDMLHLLIEARKDIQKEEETNTVETGFATVEESNLGQAKKLKNLSDDDITGQALSFFFAGFEHVLTLLCFMGYELGVHHDIQDRLRAEIKETVEETNGKLSYEALMKMKYLDMVVTETLRKWPSASGVNRVCNKAYTIQPEKPGEVPLNLEVGEVIFLPIYGIHRDPQYYPNPDKFDPERFNDENKGKIKPYTFIPFGVGPRNCIGNSFALMVAKILMFHILNNFKIVPTKKSVIPVKLTPYSFTMDAVDGFWFGFQKL